MESISQAKILSDVLHDDTRKFEEQHIRSKNWRLFARNWPDDVKKEHINKALDQINIETDAFLEMQDSAIEFLKYLLITEGGYER